MVYVSTRRWKPLKLHSHDGWLQMWCCSSSLTKHHLMLDHIARIIRNPIVLSQTVQHQHLNLFQPQWLATYLLFPLLLLFFVSGECVESSTFLGIKGWVLTSSDVWCVMCDMFLEHSYLVIISMMYIFFVDSLMTFW